MSRTAATKPQYRLLSARSIRPRSSWPRQRAQRWRLRGGVASSNGSEAVRVLACKDVQARGRHSSSALQRRARHVTHDRVPQGVCIVACCTCCPLPEMLESREASRTNAFPRNIFQRSILTIADDPFRPVGSAMFLELLVRSIFGMDPQRSLLCIATGPRGALWPVDDERPAIGQVRCCPLSQIAAFP